MILFKCINIKPSLCCICTVYVIIAPEIVWKSGSLICPGIRCLSSKLRLTLKDWTWVSGKCPGWLSDKSSSNRIYKDCGKCGWSLFCFCKKNDPSVPDFSRLDALVPWQQSAPTSEKLRWRHSGCTLNDQLELWEIQDNLWHTPFSVFAFMHPA